MTIKIAVIANAIAIGIAITIAIKLTKQ